MGGITGGVGDIFSPILGPGRIKGYNENDLAGE